MFRAILNISWKEHPKNIRLGNILPLMHETYVNKKMYEELSIER